MRPLVPPQQRNGRGEARLVGVGLRVWVVVLAVQCSKQAKEEVGRLAAHDARMCSGGLCGGVGGEDVEHENGVILCRKAWIREGVGCVRD